MCCRASFRQIEAGTVQRRINSVQCDSLSSSVGNTLCFNVSTALPAVGSSDYPPEGFSKIAFAVRCVGGRMTYGSSSDQITGVGTTSPICISSNKS